MVISPSTQHRISSREETYQINRRKYFTGTSHGFQRIERGEKPSARLLYHSPGGLVIPRGRVTEKNEREAPFLPETAKANTMRQIDAAFDCMIMLSIGKSLKFYNIFCIPFSFLFPGFRGKPGDKAGDNCGGFGPLELWITCRSGKVIHTKIGLCRQIGGFAPFFCG